MHNKYFMYLCIVINNDGLTLKNSSMNEELEKAISRKKKEISDYVRIAKSLHIEEAEIQKRVDLLLGDLSKLLRMRK